MDLRPEDCLNLHQDPRRFRDLKRELRRLPDEQRGAFIVEIIRQRPSLGLRLANACMRNRQFFESLLDEGIQHADLSRISMWLKCIVPRVGASRVLNEVKRRMDADPDVAQKVLYWMPRFLPQNSKRQRRAFESLKAIAAKKGYLQGPQRAVVG